MQNYDTYHDLYLNRKKRIKRTIWSFYGLVGILVAVMASHSCSKEPQPAYHTPLLKSHNRLTDKQWKMAKYFQKIGSKKPDKMAVAVCATKKPRLMAAMAKIETHGNPDARYTGYKKRHHGAWQVNPRDWGTVSHDALEQALQAEDALDKFTKGSKGNVRVALNKYGGDSTTAYQRKVLAELINVP
jgi:hypothetical protein